MMTENMDVEPSTVLPSLQLEVLATVKHSQAIHGLKHSEYSRYRYVFIILVLV
jgi:hypothetical protein